MDHAAPIEAAEFAGWMAGLGPFEPQPALAVAVSGGADSSALALLARDWAVEKGGRLVALIVDHGLREVSAAEAALTAQRLQAAGIDTEILTLAGLSHGAGLAARARAARYAALEAACAARGVLHLLVGHHADDQAETIWQRRRAGSGARGQAGMAALREMWLVRLVRPLLGVGRARLRATCAAHGLDWVEDPGNQDPATGRGRARAALRAGPDGSDGRAEGAARSVAQEADARVLAERAGFSPLGYGWLTAGPIAPEALGALLRVFGGRAYAPRGAALAALAAAPRPATLGNARLLARRAGGLWIVRERPAPPCPARDGARWGNYRLAAPALAEGLWIGAVGGAQRGWILAGRGAGALPGALPGALLAALPGLWQDGRLIAVPGPCARAGAVPWQGLAGARFWFEPVEPAAGAPWIGMGDA